MQQADFFNEWSENKNRQRGVLEKASRNILTPKQVQRPKCTLQHIPLANPSFPTRSLFSTMSIE